MRNCKLPEIDRFLTKVDGIIHIGAHRGPERHLYGSLDLEVIWVEADPLMYVKLKKNISGYPKQKAINALVSDVFQEDVTFNRSSNSGASSSMFDFQEHAEKFPGVTMVDKLTLKAMPFTQIAAENGLDMNAYQGLIIDVQGAELHVLKGFGDQLKHFDYVQLETSNFPAYKGGVMIEELNEFMESFGYKETIRDYFGDQQEEDDERKYFDVLYVKL